ncbi:MAG: oligosaccharide flippase family protein [Thermus sp.]|nr:oligosaccharide flippase family protein [Thermus sp.]
MLAKKVVRYLFEQWRHPLSKNTAWMLVGYSVRLVFQSIAFVLLARALGPEDFGAFMAMFAVANLIAPFVGLGGYSLVNRDVVDGIAVRQAYGNALALSIFALPLGLVLVKLVNLFLLPDIPWLIALFVSVGVLLGGNTVQIVQGLNVSQNLLWRNALLETLNGVILLLWVVLFVIVGGRLMAWSLLFLVHYIFMATVSLAWSIRTWGWPQWSFAGVANRVGLGLHFALGSFSQVGSSEVDKALLARLGGMEAAGIYSAAQRIIVAGFYPLMAFLAANYARFFQLGRAGIRSTRVYAFKIAPFVLAYTVISGIIIWVAAPLIARLLGSEFTQTGRAIRWLAMLLVIQGLQYPFADALTGAGLQSVRSGIQVAALFLVVVGNAILIPRYGWLGAVWTSLLVSGLVLVAMMGALMLYSKEKEEDAKDLPLRKRRKR